MSSSVCKVRCKVIIHSVDKVIITHSLILSVLSASGGKGSPLEPRCCTGSYHQSYSNSILTPFTRYSSGFPGVSSKELVWEASLVACPKHVQAISMKKKGELGLGLATPTCKTPHATETITRRKKNFTWQRCRCRSANWMKTKRTSRT